MYKLNCVRMYMNSMDSIANPSSISDATLAINIKPLLVQTRPTLSSKQMMLCTLCSCNSLRTFIVLYCVKLISVVVCFHSWLPVYSYRCCWHLLQSYVKEYIISVTCKIWRTWRTWLSLQYSPNKSILLIV